MIQIRKLFLFLIAGCFALTWAGCDKGPLDKAGKAVDEKVTDIKIKVLFAFEHEEVAHG